MGLHRFALAALYLVSRPNEYWSDVLSRNQAPEVILGQEDG